MSSGDLPERMPCHTDRSQNDSFRVAGGLGDTAATKNNVQEAKLLIWELCQDIVNKDILGTVTNISKNTLTL